MEEADRVMKMPSVHDQVVSAYKVLPKACLYTASVTFIILGDHRSMEVSSTKQLQYCTFDAFSCHPKYAAVCPSVNAMTAKDVSVLRYTG